MPSVRSTFHQRSRSSFSCVERDGREMRARKVLEILKGFAELRECKVLDIGTGSGYMATLWAKEVRELTSVDVQDQRVSSCGYDFQVVQGEELPFTSGCFDIVISNQVIEHVWNPELHVSEIRRVLKDDGIAYLSTPNRYTLIEPHYRLPLLAWFGDRVASAVLRFAKRTSWDVRLFSYRSLCRLLKGGGFEIVDQVPTVMSDPVGYYHLNP